MRITKAVIQRRVEILQGKGIDIGTDNAYGKMAICNSSQSQNFSALNTPAQNIEFLKGFEWGIEREQKRIRKTYPELINFLKSQDNEEAKAFLKSINVFIA